jgi:hypothetical protein
MPDKTTYENGWDWAATPDPDWGQMALGSVQHHQWLTLFPLIDRRPRHLPYRLLADALEAGTVEVAEVGTGSVPEVAVENSGDEDVLVLDGEQLVGAKQNRTVSRTMIHQRAFRAHRRSLAVEGASPREAGRGGVHRGHDGRRPGDAVPCPRSGMERDSG